MFRLAFVTALALTATVLAARTDLLDATATQPEQAAASERDPSGSDQGLSTPRSAGSQPVAYRGEAR